MADDRPRRFNAYYYGFDPTGVDAVDEILSAVAWAGKRSHHTDGWTDDGSGPSEAERIQCAANAAAEAFRQLEGAQVVAQFAETIESTPVAIEALDRLCRLQEQEMALHSRILELEEALRPFAKAFRQEKYGAGVSAHDWKRAFDAYQRREELEAQHRRRGR